MRARRRLPVIVGMALSAVMIAAPAAHADTINPKQDCSRFEIEGPHGSNFALAALLQVGLDLLSGGILNDSLNCSNFLNDLAILSPQARVNSSNVNSGNYNADDDDKKHWHKDNDKGKNNHKNDHNDWNKKDHHRGTAGTASTASTASTAPTAATAPTAKKRHG